MIRYDIPIFADMKPDILLVPGCYIPVGETKPYVKSKSHLSQGFSVRHFVEQCLVDYGYPVEGACNTLCGEQRICSILENAGCAPDGAAPTVANGLTDDGDDFVLGGALDRNTTVTGGSTYNLGFTNLNSFNVTTAHTPADSSSVYQMGSTTSAGFLLRHLNSLNPAHLSEIDLNWSTGNNFRHSKGVNGAFYQQTGAQADDPLHTLSVVQGSSGKTFSISKDNYTFLDVKEEYKDRILYYDQFTGQISSDVLKIAKEDTDNGGFVYFGDSISPYHSDFALTAEHISGLNNVSYHWRLDFESAQIGLRDGLSVTPTALQIKTFTSGTPGTFIRLLGLPSFPDPTAAAAGAPADALWVDSNNFIRINP